MKKILSIILLSTLFVFGHDVSTLFEKSNTVFIASIDDIDEDLPNQH
ncbi:hypothetical protein [Cytobacillus sp. IB215665]|nr:hypothetical protein [Cytobacillus sp. IB215665]MDX8365443.1 hypothetical protein [Cytobacillus sp. IB215665]